MPLVEYEEVNGILVPYLEPGTPVVLRAHPLRGGGSVVGEIIKRHESGRYGVRFPDGSAYNATRNSIQPLFMSNVEQYLNGEFDAQ